MHLVKGQACFSSGRVHEFIHLETQAHIIATLLPLLDSDFIQT